MAGGGGGGAAASQLFVVSTAQDEVARPPPSALSPAWRRAGTVSIRGSSIWPGGHSHAGQRLAGFKVPPSVPLALYILLSFIQSEHIYLFNAAFLVLLFLN